MRLRTHLTPALLFLVGLISVLAASAVTGPAFEEVPRLAAVDAAQPLIRRIADQGPSALWSADGAHSLSRLGTPFTFFSLLGAWASLSLGRLGIFDLITAARLPLLLVSALAPVALFAMLRPRWGDRAGILCAVALLCTPRFLHEAAVTSTSIFLTSIALLVAAFGQAARSGPRRLRHTLGACLTLALGAAHSLAVLWIVLALLLAHWARSIRWRRSGPGFSGAPAWLLPGLAAIPAGMLLLNPALWKSGSVGIARFALSPLAVSVSPTWYLGTLVQAPPLPGAYPALWLLWTTPLAMLVAAALALPLLLRTPGLGAGWRAGPVADLSALALLGLCSALMPSLLLRFPFFLGLALPLIAVAFVWTLITLEPRVPRVARAVAPAVVVLAALPGLLELPTAGAGFGVLSGGTATVLTARALDSGDGSELASIVPAVDALGHEQLSVTLPARVPKGYFDRLHDSKRMRTRITARGPNANATLSAGPGPAAAAVTRDGAVLWRLETH